jgi:NAD(P)H-hydrate repair Nnr-like enzyme with NAD(P)H-hydrate dehydratase domain
MLRAVQAESPQFRHIPIVLDADGLRVWIQGQG